MSLEKANELQRLGRFDEARETLRELIATTDPALTVDARLLIAKLCIFGGSHLFDEAQHCLSSIKANVLSDESYQLSMALNLRALLERSRGKRQLARELLQKNPALDREEPSAEKSQCLHYLGLLANEMGDVDLAQQQLFLAYEIADAVNHVEGKAEICDTIAGLLLKLGKTKTALAFAQRSLQAKEELEDRYGTAITLGTIGRIQIALANDREAEAAFRADLEIARELDDRNGMAIMLNSLGDIARRAGDYAGALDCFDQSLAANESELNQIYANIGRCWTYLAKEELDQAAESWQTADQLLKKHESFPELTAILQGLNGVVTGRNGNRLEAIGMLEGSIGELESQMLGFDSIPFRYELRDFYWAEGQTTDAIQVMSTALDLLSEIGSQRGVDDVESWLRNVDQPRLTRVAIERHVPDSVVDQILSGELSLPKPRKQKLTILFSDLRGFTTLSEQHEPEYVVDLLNEWFSEATRAIQKQGGIVDKFIGDAVMALFGVNEFDEQTPARAVQAARDMRSALKLMNQRNSVLGVTELSIGIGIATGDAVVGFMGSHLRHAYTAIGDPVNVAARLEAKTRNFEDCDIIIDQLTMESLRASDVADANPLGELQLKGKSKPVQTYQVPK